MSGNVRIALAVAASWLVVLGAACAIGLLAAADLGEAERALLAPILRERAATLVLGALLLIVPLAVIVRALFTRYVAAPAALVDDAQIIVAANPSHRAPPRGAAELKRVAAGLNAVADARESLLHDVDRRVREANERIEQERNRLAALMSELAHSVIVCNIEGRVLLYNARAMQLLRQPLDATAAAGKAHTLIGLGRSIFAVFDRNVIIHALEILRDRLRQRTRAPVASFVATTPAGQLVRMQMAPVLGAAPDPGGEGVRDGITGFVLVIVPS